MTEPIRLQEAQRRALRDEGYVLLPGAVARAQIDEALRAINLSLGSAGIDPQQLATFRSRTYTPELVSAPAITNLYSETPLAALAAAAIGEGQVHPPPEGQIALRFPTAGGGAPVPHIDGIATETNGVPRGTLWHFTALGGVFLNDVTEENRGNFSVWPGSHRVITDYLRVHGPEGMYGGFPEMELGAPRQITARAGDVLLAHYALAHGIAPNLGPHIRYAVFFRLFHSQHDEHGRRALDDPWLEWPGVR